MWERIGEASHPTGADTAGGVRWVGRAGGQGGSQETEGNLAGASARRKEKRLSHR